MPLWTRLTVPFQPSSDCPPRSIFLRPPFPDHHPQTNILRPPSSDHHPQTTILKLSTHTRELDQYPATKIPQPSAFYHLPPTTCLLPPAFCHLPSTTCPLPPAHTLARTYTILHLPDHHPPTVEGGICAYKRTCVQAYVCASMQQSSCACLSHSALPCQVGSQSKPIRRGGVAKRSTSYS